MPFHNKKSREKKTLNYFPGYINESFFSSKIATETSEPINQLGFNNF